VGAGPATDGGAPPPDAGNASDAGAPPDAGAPDAGGARDAGPADAGGLAYDLLDLGPAVIDAINQRGQVAGTVGLPGSPGVASVFTPGQGWMAVPTPDGAVASVPAGLDANGKVGLNSEFPFQRSFYRRAYTTPPLQAIPTAAAPGQNSALRAVQPATGHMVGVDEVFGPFLIAGGAMTPVAGAVVPLDPAGLDEHDRVVGAMTIASGGRHAFLWDRGAVTDLGGGTFPPCDKAAVGINGAGVVVGMIDVGERCGQPRVFLWDGQTHVAGCPRDLQACEPFAINARGDVVGNALLPDGLEEAGFLYRDGAFLLLRDLVDAPGWQLQSPIGINDSGQIAGFGLLGVEQHGFLLTPRR
jgi:hypothetical protein